MFTWVSHLSISWAKPIQSTPSQMIYSTSILILSFQLCLVLKVVSFPQVSPPETCIHLSSTPYMQHGKPISFFSIWSPELIWETVQIMKFLNVQFRPVPCYLHPLRSKLLPQYLILKHPQPMFSHQPERPSFTPT